MTQAPEHSSVPALANALSGYGAVPNFLAIVHAVAGDWPEHQTFIAKGLRDRSPETMRSVENNAQRIRTILCDAKVSAEQLGRDYRFLCGKLLEEELHFRRNQRYRLSTFAEALNQVYTDVEFMHRYMNFLLVSYVLWDNHVRAVWDFEHGFLPMVRQNARHLEIGPGHGLLLQLATESPRICSITGWDVSATSIEHTRRCLNAMGTSIPVELRVQNLFDAPATSVAEFDSMVLSEVLEHLEDPVSALRAVRSSLSDDGLLWINVPLNSPAPDHIFLIRTLDDALNIVHAGGFIPLRYECFPMTGVTLAQAWKNALTVSVAITARKG